MSIANLNITKTWDNTSVSGHNTRELNWQGLKNDIESWATNYINNVVQIGIDIFDTTYVYNNDGDQTSNYGSPYLANLPHDVIWKPFGNSMEGTPYNYIVGSSDVSLTALSSTNIVGVNGTSDRLVTINFDGEIWSQVGNALMIGAAGSLTGVSITALNTTDIACTANGYADGSNGLRTYRFDGTDWSQVGNNLAIGVGSPSISALNDTDIAFAETLSDELRTYRFDGTDWAQVGNSLSLPVGSFYYLTALNSTDIALVIDFGSVCKLYTYRFDGTDWAQVGNELVLDDGDINTIDAQNSSVIILGSDSNHVYSFYFNGTDWRRISNVVNIQNVKEVCVLEEDTIAIVRAAGDPFFAYKLIPGLANVSATIDNCVIGGTTPSTGNFTSLTTTNTYRINIPGSAFQPSGDLDVTKGAWDARDNYLQNSDGDRIARRYFTPVNLPHGMKVTKVTAHFDSDDASDSAYVSLNYRDLAGNNDFTWVEAEQVGNDLSIAGVSYPALAALNSTDVAFIDGNNDDLRTYRFDGTDWSQVGNDLSIAGVGGAALAALNSTDVAFIDSTNDDLRTYRFDGTDWSQVGNDLSIAGVNFPVLAALNGTDVAFIDRDNDDLRTYRFDGTDWSQVGNDLNIADVGYSALAALNSTDVAFIDSTNDDLRTYRFDGTDWSQVGNDLSIADVGYPALAALNGTDVAFIDGGNDDLRTYRFDGTDWSQVGNELNIADVGFPALAALNGTDVAFIDYTNDDLRTYRFSFNEMARCEVTANGGNHSVSDTSIVNETIDNENSHYFLKVNLDEPAGGSGLSLLAVVIEYEF